MTESSEESDVDHSELEEEVQSSRILTQSSNTDSESEEENDPVHGFVIESILHEKKTTIRPRSRSQPRIYPITF